VLLAVEHAAQVHLHFRVAAPQAEALRQRLQDLTQGKVEWHP